MDRARTIGAGRPGTPFAQFLRVNDRRLDVIALDLEGTLISNAVSQIPRPGLREFLEFCRRAAPRVVLFTAVPTARCRTIARVLAAEGSAPEWFAGIECVDWHGPYKDLSLIRRASPATTVLVDDQEAYVDPSQKERWIPIRSYVAPYPREDRELERVHKLLARHA